MSEGLLVDEAMSLGLQAELLGMLDGSSQYFDARFFEDLDRHSRRLRSMTLLHLQFAVTFNYTGSETRHITVGKIIHSSYPDYFEAWKLAGIPGMSVYLLGKMIEDYRSRSAPSADR
ncbi:hypothetical protein [Rhizobium hainanense]|uniref:Uncharacterized protein n=1 Tax=Rhizobium hainanense TaxID=52131 RepID=A0A1C3WIT9_9HYPH|nr:hypothetical protein [Rhizobium hainanense]SCB39858.1 hypothetical protein GA0061100_1216 [Rhizobium hainanense]